LTPSPPIPDYRLLDAFDGLFRGQINRHRDSTQGDRTAVHVFEDLLNIERSRRYRAAVMERKGRPVNLAKLAVGLWRRAGEDQQRVRPKVLGIRRAFQTGCGGGG
jgi:hypothetical protein